MSLRNRLPNVWFVGVGAAFDMAAGHRRRAPRVLQRIGLEWAFRLAQEPRRLARRYLANNMPFLFRLLRNSITIRIRGARATPS
jgi:N-acetylglucosaminyldiphosphoundecaprenol N-acetyl-beta-D-mannosaminyltransferase